MLHFATPKVALNTFGPFANTKILISTMMGLYEPANGYLVTQKYFLATL